MPQILILGSGLVARPCVEYLLRSEGNKCTVGMFFFLIELQLSCNRVAIESSLPLQVSIINCSPWPKALLTFKTACRTLSIAQKLASGFPRTQAISLDVSNQVQLDEEVAAHQLVISLIPYTYHVLVIESAIKAKVNVVTTSYVSPAMREQELAVKEAGIVVMNEVGVDPGVDHVYAIKTIGEVHEKGGKVSFPIHRF